MPHARHLDAACAPCQEAGRLEEAEGYCIRLLDFGGPAKEGAKSLLREIRAVAGGGHDDMAVSPSG
jgi:hypothetical protein